MTAVEIAKNRVSFPETTVGDEAILAQAVLDAYLIIHELEGETFLNRQGMDECETWLSKYSEGAE